jgi:hypothetical protein
MIYFLNRVPRLPKQTTSLFGSSKNIPLGAPKKPRKFKD